MISANEAFRQGVFRKVEGALEVLASKGTEAKIKNTQEIQTLISNCNLDLTEAEIVMVCDAILGTSNSPYSKPPKNVVDRYSTIHRKWQMFRLVAAH